MNYIFIIYTVVVIYVFWNTSRHKTLYVFNPILMYLSFAISNIYPLVTYERILPQNIINVTCITCVINLLFIFIFRKQFLKKVEIQPDMRLKKYANNRKAVLCFFLGIMIATGFYTGVTQNLLHGGDVENLRKTSEVGLGFLRAIPVFGIPYLVVEYYILNRKLTFIKAGIIGLSIGFVLYMVTAGRHEILTYAMCFFVWFNLKYRGFKWYEYFCIFYLMGPVISTILKAIRSANIIELFEFQLFAHEQMIFGANTVRLAIFMEQNNIYLWGASYVFPIVRLIPRFIWPDKPVSIDYTYKEMAGMDFDGGGIYTTADFDMFLNFGYYYIIEYVLWLLLIHWMYKKLIDTYTKFANKILIITLILGGTLVGTLIQNIQLYFLFLIIFLFVNKKWRVV